jgi:hypothetical protein
MARIKDKSRQESLVRESVAKERMTLGVDNLGLGCLLLFEF